MESENTSSGRSAARPAGDVQARLLEHLHQAGYARVEPPILQDAAIFLDLGGEDIRASLYLTGDGSGAELCLRPEYTIPACRTYLDTDDTGAPAAFSYAGPVFRQRAAAAARACRRGWRVSAGPTSRPRMPRPWRSRSPRQRRPARQGSPSPWAMPGW